MVIPLVLNLLRYNWWVCYGRYPQYLVVYYYFLVAVLNVIADSMLLLVFARSALVWVGYKSVVAYP